MFIPYIELNMSSVSQKHRTYTSQPHYQTAYSKCLPQTNPKERQDRPPNRSIGKKKKQTLQFIEEYQYIQKMIKQAKPAYNWRLLNPKKLGYIMVEMWSNPTCSHGNRHSATKSTSEKPLLWGFKAR